MILSCRCQKRRTSCSTIHTHRTYSCSVLASSGIMNGAIEDANTEQEIYDAFNMFDGDGSKNITAEELKKVRRRRSFEHDTSSDLHVKTWDVGAPFSSSPLISCPSKLVLCSRQR